MNLIEANDSLDTAISYHKISPKAESKRSYSVSTKEAPPTFSKPVVSTTSSLTDEEKRGRAILEILETEQTYQKSLGDFIGFYLRNLEARENEEAKAFMKESSLAALCSNIEQIFHLSLQFIGELKSAFENVAITSDLDLDDFRSSKRWARISIGPIFSRFSSLLTLYEQYVENHGFGKRDLLRFTDKQNTQFQLFWQKSGQELKASLDTTSYRSRRGSVESVATLGRRQKSSESTSSSSVTGGPLVSLDGYLILPIQRIPRYVLLLKELKKLTSKICLQSTSSKQLGLERFYELEANELNKALDLVSASADRMNECMRASEANMALWDLERKFSSSPNLVRCDGKVRTLVRDGMLKATSPHLFKRERIKHIHLLTDCFLISDERPEGTLFSNTLIFPLVHVLIQPLDAFSFLLMEHPENRILLTLKCNSESEQVKWLQAFQSCISSSSFCNLPLDTMDCPLCKERKFMSVWCKRCGIACCPDCSNRKRMLDSEEGPHRVCNMCRLELDLTPTFQHPQSFRLVVRVLSRTANHDFFSLTPRESFASSSEEEDIIRGASSIGHMACFSIPCVQQFWRLHAFSAQQNVETGQVDLDIHRIICSREMFAFRKTNPLTFALANKKGIVRLSFELLFPPLLWSTVPSSPSSSGMLRASDDDDEDAKPAPMRTAPMLEQRFQRFVPFKETSVLNLLVLTHFEKLARDSPSRFTVLCVKYLYAEATRKFARLHLFSALALLQERNLKFESHLLSQKPGFSQVGSDLFGGSHLVHYLSRQALECFEATVIPLPIKPTSTPRGQILNEFLISEQTYVSSLKVLNQVFVAPIIHLSHGASVSTVIHFLKVQRGGGTWLQVGNYKDTANAVSAAQDGSHMILPAHVIVLLQSLRQIYSVNAHLLSELLLRVTHPLVVVGDIFKRFAVVLKVYIAYLINFNASLKLFQQTDNRLSEFVRFLEQDNRGPKTFVGLLSLPKERLTRYKRFLFGLLMHTPEGHGDCVLLRDSLSLLEESEKHIAWFVRRSTNTEKLGEIQKSLLKALPLIGERLPQLVDSRRWFVREGYLAKRCRKEDVIFRFWLFNDGLAYGERMGSQFRFCRFLTMKDITVLDLPPVEELVGNAGGQGDVRFAFEIRHATKSFVVMVPMVLGEEEMRGSEGSMDDKKQKLKSEWLKDLEQCIEEENDESVDEEEEDYAPVWQNDLTSTQCSLCHVKFAFWLRRHHCRRCGCLVCNSCSRSRQILENISSAKKQRVCNKCVAGSTEII